MGRDPQRTAPGAAASRRTSGAGARSGPGRRRRSRAGTRATAHAGHSFACTHSGVMNAQPHPSPPGTPQSPASPNTSRWWKPAAYRSPSARCEVGARPGRRARPGSCSVWNPWLVNASRPPGASTRCISSNQVEPGALAEVRPDREREHGVEAAGDVGKRRVKLAAQPRVLRGSARPPTRSPEPIGSQPCQRTPGYTGASAADRGARRSSRSPAPRRRARASPPAAASDLDEAVGVAECAAGPLRAREGRRARILGRLGARRGPSARVGRRARRRRPARARAGDARARRRRASRARSPGVEPSAHRFQVRSRRAERAGRC